MTIEITTTRFTKVAFSDEHQTHINQILQLHKDGLTYRQIADHLNEMGESSWTGKRFYPELVFGVIRKNLVRQRIEEKIKFSATCESVSQ